MTITPELKKYFSDLGKKSAAKLTKEQRIDRAKKAVKAREDRKHKQKITNRIERLVKEGKIKKANEIPHPTETTGE